MRQELVVFVTYGSYGDINPLLAIAQRLVASCDVLFITNEYYRPHVEAAGVPFHGCGSVEEQLSCIETTRSSGRSMDGLMHQFRTHVGSNIARIGACLKLLYRNGRKMLVVTHGDINPAFPVCEKLEIPVVRAYLAPSHLPLNKEDFLLQESFHGSSRWRAQWLRYPRHALNIRLFGPPHARKEYDQFRVQAGFAKEQLPYQTLFAKWFAHNRPQLNTVAELLLTPKWFAEPLGPELHKVHCTGFPYYDTASRNLDRKLQGFIKRYGSPVVFIAGTGMEEISDFCKPIESICRKLKRSGVLLARHGAAAFRDMQRTCNHPIMHVEFTDLQWLLPRCALAIHPGGIGTIAQIIRAGIPQIVYPMVNDQHRNALRVLLNGVGGMAYGDGFNSDNVATIYAGMKSSEHHRSCLAHYSQELKSDDGSGAAAKVLLDVLKKRYRPIHADDEETVISAMFDVQGSNS